MGNENKPIVTIGMPVYNGEKYIRKSLDSILSQTFTDFELIISDNASTDSTEIICSEYIEKDSRIKYNRFNENFGASKNYNYLFGVASGKYFRWANDDDLWGPTNLEKCVEVLDNNSDVILCYPKTIIIDESDNFVRHYDDNLNLIFPDATYRFRYFAKNIGLSNVLYGLIRSDILRQTYLLGNYIGSDIVLIGELSLYGKFYEIQEYMFYRRFHPMASSSDKSIENQQLFFDPNTKGRLSFILLRHPYQYFISAFRAPIGYYDKIRLFHFIFTEMVINRNNIIIELFDNIKIIKKRMVKRIRNV